MRNNSSDNSDTGNTSSGSGGTTSALVDSVDQMVKLPFQMTGATWDFMMQGVRTLTGGSSDSGSSSGSSSNTTMSGNTGNTSNSGTSSGSTNWSTSGSSNSSSNQGSSTTGITSTITGNNQDLSGDDLKYVVWSIVFTKPGYECVLEQQQSEIVNYSADPSTFAALKIAKFLEKARNGRAERTSSWVERNYPTEPAGVEERRTDIITSSTGTDTTTVASTTADTGGPGSRGYRLPAEDQKFITFIYRVDWRLPRQEEAVRVERVTIERGTTTTNRL